MPGPDQLLGGGIAFAETIDPEADAARVRFGIFDGDPNGIVSGSPGSMLQDFATPALWLNTDGATAWANVSDGIVTAAQVIWAPNGADDPLAGVYTTWADAHAAAAVLRDAGLPLVTIWVDAAPGAPGQIPADTFDMNRIKLQGPAPFFVFPGFPNVMTSDGTVFTNWHAGIENLQFQHNSTTPLMNFEDPATGFGAWLGSNCAFEAIDAPIFRMAPGGAGFPVSYFFFSGPQVNFLNVANPPFEIDTARASVKLVLGEGSALNDNTITGAAGTMIVTYLGTLFGTQTQGRVQGAFAGSIVINAQISPYEADPGDWNGAAPTDLQDAVTRIAEWIRVNGGGPLP